MQRQPYGRIARPPVSGLPGIEAYIAKLIEFGANVWPMASVSAGAFPEIPGAAGTLGSGSIPAATALATTVDDVPCLYLANQFATIPVGAVTTYSIGLLIRVTTWGSDGGVMRDNKDAGGTIALLNNGTSLALNRVGSADTTPVATRGSFVNTWRMVVVTKNGTTGRVLVDGNQDTVTTSATSGEALTSPMAFCCNGAVYNTQRIDACHIAGAFYLARELTRSDVAELWETFRA